MKIVPINNATHRTLKILESQGFPHARNQHMAILAACEIMSSSINYPVVFTKHPETGRFLCLALFGLESGENLFFDKDSWNATYIPMNITRAPFAMVESGKGDDTMLICIDEDSPYISETEGAALFDKGGNQTEFLDNVVSSLSDMKSNERHTQLFTEKLVDMRLLVPISEQLLDLYKADYLGPIYSLINSLELLNRLVVLRNMTSNKSITNIQLKYSN
jgi:hypothetical protein